MPRSEAAAAGETHRRMARTTSRSTKGILRLPMICSRSCPFPATSTQSPASAHFESPADGFAPVGFDDRRMVHGSQPETISRMICSGSSDRGLSLVKIARSASLAARPMQRPLAAVAVAAGSHRADHAAASQPLERSDAAPQGVFRVGVVDEHVERLSAFDPLQPAGNEPQGFDTRFDFGERNIEPFHGGGGRQAIGNIVPADERRGDFDRFGSAMQAEPCAAKRSSRIVAQMCAGRSRP